MGEGSETARRNSTMKNIPDALWVFPHRCYLSDANSAPWPKTRVPKSTNGYASRAVAARGWARSGEKRLWIIFWHDPSISFAPDLNARLQRCVCGQSPSLRRLRLILFDYERTGQQAMKAGVTTSFCNWTVFGILCEENRRWREWGDCLSRRRAGRGWDKLAICRLPYRACGHKRQCLPGKHRRRPRQF